MNARTIAAVLMLFAAMSGGQWLPAAEDSGRNAFWPQFHGPNRDNMSSDTGLLKQWPEGGPKLVWKSAECGMGYSMVALVDGRIFTAGDFADREMVLALDMEGKLLWKTPNGPSWDGPYPGSRTTPTFDGGLVYQMGPTGRLAALEAATGKPVWAVDLKERFGGRFGTWAMAENLVVDGDRLFCVPGGTSALVAALDKRTGETVWTNADLDESAAYCSPIVVTSGGVRQLVTLTQKSLVSVDVQSGKLLWSYPQPTKHDQNVNSPIYRDGHVFAVSGHLGGGTLLRIDPDSRGVAKVWAEPKLDNCHGGVILAHGCLYGSACRSGGRTFFCADFLTGETRQTDKTLGIVSLTWADGMIYGTDRAGRMMLIAISPGEFHIASEFRLPREADCQYLAQPVVCGGRMYIRHGQNLYAYDVRAK